MRSGELGPVDIDHAAGVLQAQLGRVGLAHVRAARAHRAVGDHLERTLNQYRGAIGQVRRARHLGPGAQAPGDPVLQLVA